MGNRVRLSLVPRPSGIIYHLEVSNDPDRNQSAQESRKAGEPDPTIYACIAHDLNFRTLSSYHKTCSISNSISPKLLDICHFYIQGLITESCQNSTIYDEIP